MDAKQEIIQEIVRVANEVAPIPLGQKMFFRKSKISSGKLRYQFGTWNKALKAAGFSPNPSGKCLSGCTKSTDEALFKAIGDLWRRTGRKPTEDSMNSEGPFSTKPYRDRWGKFSLAVNEYIKRFGIPNDQYGSDISLKMKPDTPFSGKVVLPSTHKPKANVEKRKRILYGEPLDFRGLRYAPINEQGVVYLFGMVSRELGFLIESIRTDFPDCEGKRCLDTRGHKWQHVRIEFEYRSKNFLEHGHDPGECELIVCWVHDWDDCPVEVLELRTKMKKLPKEL
ncbi:MAG: homing endonuclease associated repeat-containing protein [Nitrospirales bacterium]